MVVWRWGVIGAGGAIVAVNGWSMAAGASAERHRQQGQQQSETGVVSGTVEGEGYSKRRVRGGGTRGGAVR